MLCPLLASFLLLQSPVAGDAGGTLWLGNWNADDLPDALHAPADGPARLLENQGDGTFVDVSARAGLPALERVRQALFTDLDGDGRSDLLVVAGGHIAFLAGSDGVLVDRTALAGLDALEGVAELRPLQADADGRADLWVRAAAGDLLLRQTPAGTFAPVDLGATPAPALAVAAGPDEPAEENSAAPLLESESGVRPEASRRAHLPGISATTQRWKSNLVPEEGGEEEPPGVQSNAFCPLQIRDKSTTNCLFVNTVPTLGELYPLSTDLNVSLAGYVGIGTTTPTHKLTVQNQGSDDVLRLLGTGSFGEGARLNFGDADYVQISEVTDDKLEIAAIGGTNFTGDVGIGTPDPSFALDVTKLQAVARLRTTASTNGSVIELRNDLAGPAYVGALNFTNNLGQTEGQIAYTGFGDLTFRVNGTERAHFFAAGQVYLFDPLAINVSTPSNTAYFENQATAQYSSAVGAVSRGPDGAAVLGWNLATTGTGEGVKGITSNSSGYGVFSAGDFGGTGAKYFVQPHPEDAAKEIRFVCLEGNESGTYFRGRGRTVGGQAVIEVPEDFRLVSEAEGLTVTTTPIGAPAALWIASQNLDHIVVRSNVDVEFNYFANGVRRGFSDLETLRDSAAYVPRERGVPYGTQYPDDLRRILVENGTLNPDFTPNEETALRLGWPLRDPEPVESSPVPLR